MTSHICAEHVYVCPRMCRRICMPARPGRVSIHNTHIYLHTHTWAWASHACQYAQYRMQNMLGTQAEREREIEYIGHLWSPFGTIIICGIYIVFIFNSLITFIRFIVVCEWQILIICFTDKSSLCCLGYLLVLKLRQTSFIAVINPACFCIGACSLGANYVKICISSNILFPYLATGAWSTHSLLGRSAKVSRRCSYST